MVSASISLSQMDFLNRWLFQQTTIANKYEIAKVPILLVPTEEFSKTLDERLFLRSTFEYCQKQIEPLTPLSHAYPFLVLGYSNQLNKETEVFELATDLLVGDSEVVIDRCIEFPPEFHQAGLNILNFFGTYIREQYPNENAKVKIEQNGKVVRLIIETSNGKKEIIEKALTEYQLVVTGQKKPEEITQNQNLILELNTELRIAKVRIETQQDIMLVQKGQINKLLEIVGYGLMNKPPISIDFKPNILLTNSTIINQNVTGLLSSISELKQMIPSISPQYFQLNDLEGSLTAIEKEEHPEVVKNSPGMQKLKNLIESISSGNSELSKALKVAENGWDTFKNLAGKYNKVAEWCGLPQVPTIFTK
jgi:hypothetical protein